MKRIFVSGCYDIIHAGHLQFFEEARALGDHLTVCFASEDVLWKHKQRRPSIPDDHKKAILEGLRMVDEVVLGTDHDVGLDFKTYFLEAKPDMLVVTEDDLYEEVKRDLCEQAGATYHILAKTPPKFKPVSTSGIVRWVKAPEQAPLRVDFAGGWLDVPKFAREGAVIVNCAISPTVSIREWNYEKESGLGGSGAWALLNGESGVEKELEMGVGWQDPAVIHETGICIWKSGPLPALEFKRNGEMLHGKMALYWSGKPHSTPSYVQIERDYDLIEQAGLTASKAIESKDLDLLGKAISMSYQAQLKEGMEDLPNIKNNIGMKYSGGGHGGYALYLFSEASHRDEAVSNHPEFKAIEPYIK